MTGLVEVSKIGAASIKDRPEETLSSKLLSPLRRGTPVALSIEDPKMPKRKRAEKPVLFITPVSVFGGMSSRLVFSLQTHGCEVCDTREPISPMALYRLGLRISLATELARELNVVFNHGTGESNGNYGKKACG